MSVSDWPRMLIRRWYLTVLGLAVTIGLVAAAAIAVPVSYAAKADVVLIPPANSTSNSDNPLLGLTGLTSAADVLARAMSDPSKVNKLKQQGANGKYTVVRDLTTDGPLLVVTANLDDSSGVLRELKLILTDMPSTLSTLQQSASVSKRYQIGLLTLSVADKPTSDRKSQLRAVIVAVVLGVVLSMLIVNVGDRLARRRSRRGVESSERLAEEAVAPDDVSEPVPGAGASAPRSPAETVTVAPKPAALPAPVAVAAGEAAQADDDPQPSASPAPVAVAADEAAAQADDDHPSAPDGSAAPVAAANGRPRNGRRPNPLPPSEHAAAPVRYRAAQINGTQINGHAAGPQRALESEVVVAPAPAPSSAARPAAPSNHAPAPPPNPDGASARSRLRRLARSARSG